MFLSYVLCLFVVLFVFMNIVCAFRARGFFVVLLFTFIAIAVVFIFSLCLTALLEVFL